MSVAVEWCGSTMIHVNFLDHWDWGEFHRGIQQAYTLMTKSQKRVSIILDFVGSVKHVSTNTLTNIVDEVQPPLNQDMIVIVTEDDELGQKLKQILCGIHPRGNSIAIAPNGEEASAIIRNKTHTLAATK
jgi:hypothetical protein